MASLSKSNSQFMLRQDFLSLRDFAMERFEKIDEKMDTFMGEIKELFKGKAKEAETPFQNPFGNDREESSGHGVHRHPFHEERRRNKEDGVTTRGRNEMNGERRITDDYEEDLRHLKLVFQAFTKVMMPLFGSKIVNNTLTFTASRNLGR